MTGEDDPVQHCTVAESVNLRRALEAATVQYLDVDEQRTIVIYQQAILMVIATEGQATAAREFDVELWKEPPTEPDRDPGGSAMTRDYEAAAEMDAIYGEQEALGVAFRKFVNHVAGTNEDGDVQVVEATFRALDEVDALSEWVDTLEAENAALQHRLDKLGDIGGNED